MPPGGILVQFRKSAAARLARLTAFAVAWIVTACSSAPPAPPVYQPPTTVSSAVTFASPTLGAERELALLAPHRTTAAQLRRAWLELQLDRPQAALDSTAEVIYGNARPGSNEEAFARYLRAEAFVMNGQPERANYDRDRARQLALDLGLQQRLGSDAPAPVARVVAADPTSLWGQLTIKRRAEWRPASPDRAKMDRMTPPSRVTLHHSAMLFRDTHPEACGAHIRRIQHEHMNNRGYSDIGYHFLIDPQGRVWEGRELRWQGAHAGNGEDNTGNIGICLLGNFMRGGEGQRPTAAQVTAMQHLVVALMHHYRFGPNAIFCHHDFKNTQCPGPHMTPVVKQLIRELSSSGGAAAAASN
jgi:hypothetical protein